MEDNTSRRRSQRVKGKKVNYDEKIMTAKVSPKKNTKKQRLSKKKSPQKDAPILNEVVLSNKEESTPEEGGLASLGFELIKVDAKSWSEKSDHLKVKETVRLFSHYYLHNIQEEEKRCSGVPKTEEISNGIAVKAKSKRPDLKASKMVRDAKRILYAEKRIGAIPGVDVGHQFFSRSEMVVVGFHSHWLNGIDYIGKNQPRREDIGKYRLPLATAIVMSGQYEDDLDNSEDVIYTGQGGNDLLGNKRQMKDQVMEAGNLALKNSMLEKLPVRVIRGHPSKSSYVGKVYTYDGLYNVVDYWAEKGISGHTVFKFRMKRIDGQPELTTTQVQFIRGKVPDTIAEVRGLVCEDISGGQESIKIPATNLVDDPPVPPTGFTYTKKIQVSSNVKIPAPPKGCSCRGKCVDPRICACAKRNGSDFPYVHRDGGRLVEPKGVVFECGPTCGCGSGCINRTSQKGIKFRLEVFRTPKKGWGVRSWDYIPSGSPICEYTGILKRSDEANSVLENSFIFDIDCLQTMKGLDGREMRLRHVSIPSEDSSEKEIEPEYCIDAISTGNVTRFINHSCEPNLFVQCVLDSHHDLKLAKVMLFAADNIPPLQELTYDYGYALDSVVGPDGKFKQMACYCGAAGCRKRLY